MNDQQNETVAHRIITLIEGTYREWLTPDEYADIKPKIAEVLGEELKALHAQLETLNNENVVLSDDVVKFAGFADMHMKEKARADGLEKALASAAKELAFEKARADRNANELYEKDEQLAAKAKELEAAKLMNDKLATTPDVIEAMRQQLAAKTAEVEQVTSRIDAAEIAIARILRDLEYKGESTIASIRAYCRALKGAEKERDALREQLAECNGDPYAANPGKWPHKSQIEGLSKQLETAWEQLATARTTIVNAIAAMHNTDEHGEASFYVAEQLLQAALAQIAPGGGA